MDVFGLCNVVYCNKKRDPETGKLDGFSIYDYDPNPNSNGTELLIVDDICDGGGTFVGLAKKLREAGAKKVHLFVTHGIFSKGVPLEGIDTIYTTDSFQPDTYGFNKVVCIPVSMKDIP
jgi:ribose-phosphate pyrophosphokinase